MSCIRPLTKEQIDELKNKLTPVTCPNCGEVKALEAFFLEPEDHSPFSDIQWLCTHCKVIFRHSGCTLRDPYHRPLGHLYLNQGECPYYKLIQPKVFPRQRIHIEGDKPPYKIITENVDNEYE